MLLTADDRIDVDWDFERAELTVVARCRTRMTVARAHSTDLAVVPLSEGRHVFEDMTPDPAVRQALTKAFVEQASSARCEPSGHVPARPRESEAPTLRPDMTHQVGEPVVCLAATAEAGGRVFCGSPDGVRVLDFDGRRVRMCPTDTPVTCLHWWPQQRLLLAGTAGETVVAMDADGRLRWSFDSEMDPGVLRMGKPYWFRTADGHGGISGLASGAFLDGRDHAFVGSACTLEVLDGAGQRVKRLPVFFGPGREMVLCPGPDGSTNLLIARRPADGPALAVVNNREPDPPAFFDASLAVTSVAPEYASHVSYVSPTVHSFQQVPGGHTRVTGGFASMATDRVFVRDVDGDGQPEVVCAVNGSWSRVTVYAADGAPRWNAQFGPGEPVVLTGGNERVRIIRDLAVVQYHGRTRLVVGTDSGLVVGLDHCCTREWAQRLDSPAVGIRPLGGGWVAVACESGRVVVLDADGRTIHTITVNGAATCLATVGGRLLVGSHCGELVGVEVRNPDSAC